MDLGEVLNLVIALALIAMVTAAGFKRGNPGVGQAKDAPIGEPYRIFTREFDIELLPDDLARRLMSASPDFAKGHYQISRDAWEAAIARSAAIEVTMRPDFMTLKARLEQDGAVAFYKSCAITLLIDQSGSMKGEPIAHVAAATRQLAALLTDLGARVEVLGFSTAGWHGGFAYRKWLMSPRPKRPGRLCALAHIIYKAHDDAAPYDGYEALLNPNLLRENIDGEAILWAAERLKRRSEPSRVLIVISDGAPVDDATLMHNGPSYLTRHLLQVIDQLECYDGITLAALGVAYSVADWYKISAQCENLDHLVPAIGDVLAKVISRDGSG